MVAMTARTTSTADDNAVGAQPGKQRYRPGTPAGDALAWRQAHRAWQQAMARREARVARAGRRLTAATGGLGYTRWLRATGRTRSRTAVGALGYIRALRARSAVEAALAALEQARADGDAAVHAARLALAAASKPLLAHGPAGISAADISEPELRRLARRPRPRQRGQRHPGAAPAGEAARAAGASAAHPT